MVASGGRIILPAGFVRSPPLLLFLFAASVVFGTVATLSHHPLLLIISFDGFRYDFLDNKTMKTPNLDALVANGVRAPWIQPRYITKTFPNHFSIATGLNEESHGIVANSFFDPVLNDTFSMDDVEAKWWDVGGLPLWVLNQMAAPDRFSGGMMWPGTQAIIKNQTAHHVTTYDSKMTWKERVDIVIGWFKHNSEPANLVFLYYEKPDSIEHMYGPESIEALKAVEAVDRDVGYLVERLRATELFDKINLIVTSDHGFTDIPEENHFYMSDFVNTSMFQVFGHTPVWNILPNPGMEQEVYDVFLNASEQYSFTVYKKEDVPQVYHYRNNRRVMPIVVSMDEHYDMEVERNTSVIEHTTGNHGYNNSLMSMQVIFVAHGPQFKQGYVSEPFDSIDIFPLGCYLLGIEPTANNATMDIAKSLLRYSVTNLDDTVFSVLCVALSVSVLVAIFAVIRLRCKMKRNARKAIALRICNDEHADGAEERLLLAQ